MPSLQRLADLGAQRMALLAEVDTLTEQIRVEAIAAVRAGHEKLYVARDAGVTRRTLDRWLADG